MKNKNKEKPIVSEYYTQMHRIGTTILTLALVLFFAVPFILCLHFDIMPKISDILVAAGGLAAIFIPTSIAETFAELPVMGSSYYICLVTGNVLNLKLPAALNALKVANVKQGTEQGDAVTGLAVAVSSLVTMGLLTIGMLLLTPLQGFLSSPTMATVSKYVLPALFGCLILNMFSNDVGGGVIIHHRLRAIIIPFIACIILYLIFPDLYGSFQGFVMILCIPIIYVITKHLYKKGKITVDLPEGEAEQVAIASSTGEGDAQ